jgi:hypothetical protein
MSILEIIERQKKQKQKVSVADKKSANQVEKEFNQQEWEEK